MATWEQRDPRWHVTERPDGANVNGWHWEERNRVAWSKQRLGELLAAHSLGPAPVDPALGSASVTSVSCSGEAYQTLRKGNKKFAVYDLTVTLEWKGKWEESGAEVKGEVKVTEFCSTNEPDEWEVEVTVTGEGAPHDTLRRAVQQQKPDIHKRLLQYVEELNAL
mmetsp:Transcript_2447/g.7339  ORF Transcript_2447/g.7339 Transcript_2447/m.7339 type:complete len:165 (+) Transcript_2447:352-846(+)